MSVVNEIISELKSKNIQAWLFYDFRFSDPSAYEILKLSVNKPPSRRWFYLVKEDGSCIKLMHKIETTVLNELPGDALFYASWEELDLNLKKMFAGIKQVALSYSPNNEIPYLSKVDAGTVEKLRSFGLEIQSSANLSQAFQAKISELGYQSHLRAGHKISNLIDETFLYIQKQISEKQHTDEYTVQNYMCKRYEELGLTSYHPPVVACNENSANPHYCPDQNQSKIIKKGDFVLIDTWAKELTADSIYFDVTWVAVMDHQPSAEQTKIFEIVKNARDAAFDFIKQNLNTPNLKGCAVDDVARNVIKQSGYADYFIHRTGHSIHTETHGNGANIDNFETRDSRLLIPNTCFSLEPGIYLPGNFGIRSEVNVFLHKDHAEITVRPGQKEILCYPI